MMKTNDVIKTIIVDDNEEFIFSLKEHLALFPEVEIIGTASKYPKAKQLLLKNEPDLLFLDVEMPNKNGFELLNEVRETSCKNTKIIFYTAYDKYMIEALRKSAFDFIVKPVKEEELRDAISRYKESRINELEQSVVEHVSPPTGAIPEIISLPTATGLRFTDKNHIVLFQSSKESIFERPNWEVLLCNNERIKLRRQTNAKEILNCIGECRFIQVNQSYIVNLSFINGIEFKTRTCHLNPPFHKIELSISRNYLNELKERFDRL